MSKAIYMYINVREIIVVKKESFYCMQLPCFFFFRHNVVKYNLQWDPQRY